MAFLTRNNARIYFEETGRGEPVIAVHGLIENTLYWRHAGEILSEHFRFIAMDMRGHGRTAVEGEPSGFDEATVGEDILALADHLGIGRFHLLTHSTGGFAAVRYAMKRPGRFATLILTNTGSSTSPMAGDKETIEHFYDQFAAWFEKNDWDQVTAKLRKNPGPFFRGIMESEKSDELMAFSREMLGMNDRAVIASFIRSFYKDPDPRIPGLRKITCPCLILYGEKDDLFIQSSLLMSREIPGAEVIMYSGVGHMTALEAPADLARDAMAFMRVHPA